MSAFPKNIYKLIHVSFSEYNTTKEVNESIEFPIKKLRQMNKIIRVILFSL